MHDRQWTSSIGRGAAMILLPALALLAATPAAAANCTPAERARADRELWLNQRDQDYYLERHLPWGSPAPANAAENERLLVSRGYVAHHDGDLRIPLWTAERVDNRRLRSGRREDCFRRDPRLAASEAGTPADYSEPIFDQGHMTAAANQSASMVAVHNSFPMSNMTPQFCQFNRGIWQILEGIVRLWAREHGTIWVVNGSILDRDGDGARDADERAFRMDSNNGRRRVAVPSHFYKVLAVRGADGQVRTLSFLFAHDQTDLDGDAALAYLRGRVTSLAAIEGLAGVDLFPDATVTESDAMWPFAGTMPRSLSIPSAQCQRTAGMASRVR